jgi:hypothetical protein
VDIQLTFYGELVFYSMFIVGGLSYYLGRRKTNNPKFVTILGIVLCLAPPLNLVYLFALTIKNAEIQDVENEG